MPLGPVIGPLVMAGTLINEKDISKLDAIGVKDSKLLTPRQREGLFDKIKGIVKKYEMVKSYDRAKEDTESIISFQFGEAIAKKLLKNVKIRGKYPDKKIFENNIQLGMITKERGFISLTLHGAKKISEFDNYFVEI